MKILSRKLIAACLALMSIMMLLHTGPALAQQVLSGQTSVQLRGFAADPAFPGQEDHAAAFILQPELFLDAAGGYQRIVVTPYLRLDAADNDRSLFDLREGYWQYLGDEIEVRTGFAQVFWGVTESRHLVDIINQTDAAEGPDGEAKLGQPMIQTTWLADFGTIEAFVMPFFRERTFPGESGRLRAPALIEFDRGLQSDRVDVAVRMTRYMGDVDLGLSAFYGTSREPLFHPSSVENTIATEYPVIGQVGLDAQYTRGALLGKWESIARTGYGKDFAAITAGFEYTLSDFRYSGIDVGLLAEYHYDGREDMMLGAQRVQLTPFDDDFFGGVRLAFNDVQSTDVLGGIVADRKTGEYAVFVEASRRIGEGMRADLEIRTFQRTSDSSPFDFYSEDDFIQLRLSYFF